MGSDVYLEWKGKTEEEDKQQCTGFSIGAGDVGYLRASIGMTRENAVLRLLFPEKYWTQHSCDKYDFKANSEMLETIGLKYLAAVLTCQEIALPEQQEENLNSQQHQGHAILKALSSVCAKATTDLKIWQSSECGFRDAVMWLNSLFSFFELGMAKQQQNLKPYPYISW